MACLQASVSHGWVFFTSVMLRVGMYVAAVLKMKLVKLRAAVEGSSVSIVVQSVCSKVALSEVQSAFLKSCTCRVVAVSSGVWKLSVVRVALWSAILGRTMDFVNEGKLVKKGSSR